MRHSTEYVGVVQGTCTVSSSSSPSNSAITEERTVRDPASLNRRRCVLTMIVDLDQRTTNDTSSMLQRIPRRYAFVSVSCPFVYLYSRSQTRFEYHGKCTPSNFLDPDLTCARTCASCAFAQTTSECQLHSSSPVLTNSPQCMIRDVF